MLVDDITEEANEDSEPLIDLIAMMSWWQWH